MAAVHPSQEPLLAGKQRVLYPDCPGCKAAYLRDEGARAPVKLLVCLSYILLSNCLPISVLYPFVYFMVKDFHVAKSDEDIGYYAGWIGSSFMIGRMCSGMFWGAIADRYGRKPVIFGGLLSVLIFNTMFGLSTTFWMALVTRFVLGAFNGMLATLKAYASEICNEENQALGQALVSTSWGLGLIIGPAIGGYLAQPAEKHPDVFHEGSIFARFPYLLQALCISFFALIALPVSTLLPETLHRNHPRGLVTEEVPAREGDEIKISMPEVEEDVPLLKNWAWIAATVMYCVWSLHDIAYTEIFSLWAVSPKSSGGLSFTSSDVGSVLAVAGFAMLVVQLGVFPAVVKRFGAIQASRLGALLTIPLLAAYPFFPKIPGIWMYITVYGASILKYILTTASFTGSFILINNSVKQAQRGSANGLSLSIVSFFKAVGPASGGIIFAWAQSRRDAAILPGDQAVFVFLNAFVVLTVLSTLEPIMPKSLNKITEE